MNDIRLIDTLPRVFENDAARPSEIWRGDVVLERGKRYIIEAESGTGKSSLCAYIYGMRSDYTGRIEFDGRDISGIGIHDWQEIRRSSLAYLPQDMDLFAELTAIENIELKRVLTDSVSRENVEMWLVELGIADRRDFPVGKMSIGQRQRVAIIRALCQPFDFLLLDEPVSHLDEVNNLKVSELVTRVAAARGAGIIATSVGNHLQLPEAKHLSL